VPLDAPNPSAEPLAPIRIMLVDDSAVVRSMIARALQHDARFELVASATDGKMAIETAGRVKPDVILLDIEMPEMDGLTALPKLLQVSPRSKVMIVFAMSDKHADIAMQALQLGAIDIMTKPNTQDAGAIDTFFRDLRHKIHVIAGRSKSSPMVTAAAPKPAPAAVAPVASAPIAAPAPATSPVIANDTTTATPSTSYVKPLAIAIASSTGGPQALLTLFEGLRGTRVNVPIFITQHMPEGFTTTFAEHLAKAAGFPCHEAKNNEVVRPGIIYLAPGDYHMMLAKRGHEVVVRLNQDAPENFCRPSADPMLRSLVPIYDDALMLVVLTGMGADGLAGARDVVKAGGYVAVQDRATSVVWGMPKAVSEAKLAHAELPLSGIGELIARAIR